MTDWPDDAIANYARYVVRRAAAREGAAIEAEIVRLMKEGVPREHLQLVRSADGATTVQIAPPPIRA